MKIALVIAGLKAGGAERVMSSIATYWANRGHDIVLITAAPLESDFYHVPPNVRRIVLSEGGARAGWGRRSSGFGIVQNTLRRIAGLRAAIEASEPQVVISFVDRMNVMVLIAAVGLRLRVIVAERTNPKRHRISRAWVWLRARTYRSADALVVQTDALVGWGARLVRPGRVHVIPNPISPEFLARPLPSLASRQQRILFVGRLSEEKGVDILLRAISYIPLRLRTGWRVAVVGSGPLGDALLAEAEGLGVGDIVDWLGPTAAVVTEYHVSQLFVLSSRYEGFPNALLEAMACGCACVATDCPTGPRSIITSGVNGLLVPPEDAQAMARALMELMGDASRRQQLADAAARTAERYAVDAVMCHWERLLRDEASLSQDSHGARRGCAGSVESGAR